MNGCQEAIGNASLLSLLFYSLKYGNKFSVLYYVYGGGGCSGDDIMQ